MTGWITFAIALVAAAVFFLDRPERTPRNVGPIQWISAIGAWTLVLANASAIAIAIRDHSLILLGTAVATMAIAVYSFLGSDGTYTADRDTPEAVSTSWTSSPVSSAERRVSG